MILLFDHRGRSVFGKSESLAARCKYDELGSELREAGF